MQDFVPHYITIMGGRAYNTSKPDSDYDLYGFGHPSKEYVYFNGILGFDPIPEFGQITFNDSRIDVQLFNITKYFKLLVDNNPNIIDSVFTPDECVVHCDKIGQKVRDNRWNFIHRGFYKRFVAYAESQIKKVRTRQPVGKRTELVEKYGFDTKFAAHSLRLMYEAIGILRHDLDLRRHSDILISVRNGEWDLDEIEGEYLVLKDLADSLYPAWVPENVNVRPLLVECLEEIYGV